MSTKALEKLVPSTLHHLFTIHYRTDLEIDLYSCLAGGSKQIDAVLSYLGRACEGEEKPVALVYKHKRKPVIVFLKTEELTGEFNAQFIYRDWSAVLLKDLVRTLKRVF